MSQQDTNNASGWIKLHREFIDSKLFSRSGNTVKVAVFLMLSANHRSRFVRGIPIHRGQCVRSLTQIAESCDLSRKAVRYAIDQMKEEGFIEIDEPFGAQRGHRITICKYGTYQSDDDDNGTERLSQGSSLGNTNKNDKNKKNKREVGFSIQKQLDAMPEERRVIFEKWLQYKKEKKQTYQPTGFKSLVKKWSAKSDDELLNAVDHSSSNNYSGLFEPGKENDLFTKQPKRRITL